MLDKRGTLCSVYVAIIWQIISVWISFKTFISGKRFYRLNLKWVRWKHFQTNVIRLKCDWIFLNKATFFKSVLCSFFFSGYLKLWDCRYFKKSNFADNREFKQPRRRPQRECQKTLGFNEQNNDSARALDILVHFFAVLCKATTWNDQF